MDCSLPGYSTHGIFQARVLEWVAMYVLYIMLLIAYIYIHIHIYMYIYIIAEVCGRTR